MSKEEQFINELIGYIFAYPDDDYMTMECLCRKLHKYGLIEKKDGEWTTDFIERKTESSSEKPNNCEHITEDGVTCAKYPACDDCLDNLLNKVKGSERLVKGSEQRVADRKTEPTISKMEQVDEPQTEVDWKQRLCDMYGADRKSFDEAWGKYEADKVEDEPQTDCSWR